MRVTERRSLILSLNTTVFIICAVKFFISLCFRNHISFGNFLVWILAEIIIVQIICMIDFDLDSSIAGFLTSTGTTITLLVSPLLRKHLTLTSYNLTEKEYHSR